jgi:hypothetical protein
VTSVGDAPWSITNLRRVCQLVPTNYEGSFESADALLTKIWYTGAYTVKITQVFENAHFQACAI